MNEAEREKTEKFIKKYLAEGKPVKGMNYQRMLADSKGTKQKWVATIIKRMPYRDFLKTRYWQIIAWQVKCNSGWRCCMSGRKDHLQVHHVNYIGIHGYELFHVNDGELICVCTSSHEKLHEAMDEAWHRYLVSNGEVCSNNIYS